MAQFYYRIEDCLPGQSCKDLVLTSEVLNCIVKWVNEETTDWCKLENAGPFVEGVRISQGIKQASKVYFEVSGDWDLKSSHVEIGGSMRFRTYGCNSLEDILDIIKFDIARAGGMAEYPPRSISRGIQEEMLDIDKSYIEPFRWREFLDAYPDVLERI